MKYKEKYEAETRKVRSLDYEIKNLKSENKQLNKDYLKLKSIIDYYEGKESDIRRENNWLKTTLRLITIDGEKIKLIVPELEYSQTSMTRKL